jgi:uncharacterized protein (DUF302 family)
MKHLLPMTLVSMAAVIVALNRGVRAEPDKTPPDYTRKTAKSYAATLSAVQEAAKTEGFKISGVHDIAASLRKEGIEREPYAVVEVCKAELAAEVLKAEPRFGVFMPCRIVVYQQGENTIMTSVLPTRLLTFFPAKPEVKAAALQVDRVIETIIDTATR